MNAFRSRSRPFSSSFLCLFLVVANPPRFDTFTEFLFKRAVCPVVTRLRFPSQLLRASVHSPLSKPARENQPIGISLSTPDSQPIACHPYDEAAALKARNERAGRAEEHMARLKAEYIRKVRAKAAADAVGGRAVADGEAGGDSGWPTLEDTVRDFINEVGTW